VAADGEGCKHSARVKPTAYSCDSHVHVFDPSQFPYVMPRRFTPAQARVDDLREHMARLNLSRVVLVQPSVYGSKHDCLLHALQHLGRQARGVAVVSDQTSDIEIQQLNRWGVVGTRVNLVVDHQTDTSPALERLKMLECRTPPHWHIQWHIRTDSLRSIAAYIESSDRLHVIDHLGLPAMPFDLNSRAWCQLRELMRSGKLYVKVSAPYLTSLQATSFDDLHSVVEDLLSIRSDRVLWGSNWPHTQGSRRSQTASSMDVEEFRDFDDLAWFKRSQHWADSHANAMLGLNAQALYQFDQ
jgi:2-pyrone-4,6-dicarboxylate lactonase